MNSFSQKIKQTIKFSCLPFCPRPRMFFRGKRGVLITFDDGPRENITTSILKILKDFDFPALFFHVGNQIKLLPNITTSCYEEGHEIGNHTYYHNDPKQQNFNEFLQDYLRSERIISEQLGINKSQIFYRPPLGRLSLNLIRYWWRVNARVIFWSKQLDDYDPKIELKTIIEGFKKKPLVDGDILLLHETFGTLEALPQILENIKESKLKVVNTKEAFS